MAGALDGCFIPMFKATGPFGFRYWCYKNFCSIIVLAVCDARGVFTWIDVGRPGCFGDAATFNFSSLLNQLQSSRVLTPTQTIEGVTMRPVLLADSAFPFLPFVMKAYEPEPQNNTKESLYNYCHIQGRRIVESAFGRRKGRWWILRQSRLRDPKFMRDVTIVCCFLHNFCERGQHECRKTWRRNCRRVNTQNDTDNRRHQGAEDAGDAAVREALAEHLWNKRNL